MTKELEAFNEIIDKFAEQIMRANKEELTAINKTNAIEYLYRTPQVRLLQQALQRLEAIDNAKPSEFKIVNYKGQYYLQINVNDDEATQIQLPLLEDEIKDVQLAINKFKQINQAKPSEALESWNKIGDILNKYCNDKGLKFNDSYNIGQELQIIKQALLKAQEQEKVLSILKDSPFILQKMFENKELKNQEQYDKKYFWGTITEDKVRIIKEWLDEKNN